VVAVAIVKGEVRVLVPMFWRTWWFQISGGMACVLTLIAFHRLRLRQLTWLLNTRFEERLEERMRIAQDLHDTLLQGVLSASMQLHVAVEGMPEDSQVTARLNRIQQLMGKVIEEGQNTVQGLRSISADWLDLEQTFMRAQQELAEHGGSGELTEFRVSVKGRPRTLHPIIRDEVYRIGREALITALRNSRAKRVEVELAYSARYLRVLVRDDGCGIDPEASRPAREGRWVSSGMRERAERIGARLKARGLATGGTEIELAVPGQLAFQRQFSASPIKWLTRLFPLRAIARIRRSEAEGEK
jgi:signal transduction histidine kinase